MQNRSKKYIIYKSKKQITMNRIEREAEFKAKIAELDAYIEKMNAKSNKTDEEIKELIKAMQQVNKYLRAIGAPESAMYDL